MKLFGLVLKNLRRNLGRTLLTAAGTMMLVVVFTMICSVLALIDGITAEKAGNLKAIVTNKWQIPSRMPWSYAADLRKGGWRKEGDVKPKDAMTWQFYGGAADGNLKSADRSKFLFALAMEPKAMLTMLDELDELKPGTPDGKEWAATVARLEKTRNGLIVGQSILQRLGKQVGDNITVNSLTHKDINLEFQIVGLFPKSVNRYAISSAFNNEYLFAAYEDYQRKNNKPHPLFAEGPLNLVWMRVNDRDQYAALAAQMTDNPLFMSPAVKIETASSGIANFINQYRDILWAARWLLAPAVLFSLSLVLANAISISVRERQKELAVMKVLGFRPRQILLLVLGESVLLGTVVGLATIAAAYLLINKVAGGIPFPIAFLPTFDIPKQAFWWGPAVGGGTAFLGALLPAWSARSVKVTDVFSRVS